MSVNKINNKKSTKKTGKFFTIFTLVISFGLCIALADLFSGLITVGNFSSNASFKNSAFSTYAVSIYSTTNKQTANEFAKKIQATNGAGYVWQDGEKFQIIASIYIEENDAKKVAENITNSGQFTASVFEITFSEIKINSSYNTQEKAVLNNAINMFKTAYSSLYDISVSLDTAISTETQCKLSIANLQSEISKAKADFEALLNHKLTQNLLKLKLNLNSLSTLTQQLIDHTATDQSFSSKIKYNYTELLHIHQTQTTQLKSV